MKLQTSIRPRSTGFVTVMGDDGQTYTFKPDAAGALVADIEHDATLRRLLALGDFEPYDPLDFDAATELLRGGDGGSDDEDDEDGDAGGELASPGGLPIEANTPRKPAPDPKAGGKIRKARRA